MKRVLAIFVVAMLLMVGEAVILGYRSTNYPNNAEYLFD